MADVSSRAFKDGKFFKASQNLLQFFNSQFPLPQQLSWQQFIIPTSMTLQIIACMRGRPLPLAQLQRTQKTGKNFGKHGSITPPNVGLTPIYLTAANNKKKNLLCVFATWVRTGALGRGRQIRVQGVTDALAAVAKTFWVRVRANAVPYIEEKTNIHL